MQSEEFVPVSRVRPNQAPVGPTGDVQTDAEVRQFITFNIGTEEFGVDIMVVREIKGWTETTPIPNAPAHVRGVINLRGIIVPIFDLRARFGLGLTTPTRMHVVIIVDTGARTIGLLADAVSDIITVESSDLRPLPEVGTSTDSRFLEGLAALPDRMVTLISLAGLFAADSPDVSTASTAVRH